MNRLTRVSNLRKSTLISSSTSELFPTELRSSGIGVSTAISRFGAAAGTYLLPVGIGSIGFTPTMLGLTGVLILGTILSIAWAPETKELNLSAASDAAYQR